MKFIDLNNWSRISQFEFFRAFSQPYFDVCVRVDVTGLRQRTRENRESLFANMLFEAMGAVNEVPELRQRIRGDQVIEHALVHPNFTVLNENQVVNFCTGHYQADRAAFAADVASRSAAVQQLDALQLEDDAIRDDLVFVTSLPWLDFQSISHPFAGNSKNSGAFGDSVPRLAWGKIVESNGCASVSVQLTVHHALADGLHASRFFQALENRTR